MCVLCEAERPGHHNVRSVLRHYAPRKGRHLPCALKAAIHRRQKARSLSTRLLLLLRFPATTCTSPCACAMPKNSLIPLTFPCRRSRSRRALAPRSTSASSSSGRPASPRRAIGISGIRPESFTFSVQYIAYNSIGLTALVTISSTSMGILTD